ncbi:hypothetical protein C1H46_041625 [Malus baccata]|uniref:Uncharacterized protein n=1 Tax=Malus baccata TaxID=106549 RepID=A0A540KF30_MALBA|nr:hypothetical protein C1H46_041625 [Malus baccata]
MKLSLKPFNAKFFLTGCYDGLGRVWKAPGACTHILEGHSGPVTSDTVVISSLVNVNWHCQLLTIFQFWPLEDQVIMASSLSLLLDLKTFSFLMGYFCGGESVTVATASNDRTLRLWKFNAEETRKSTLRIRAFKILRGNTAAVQSVSAQTSGNMVCSGSWDSTINIWQTNEPDAEGDTVSTKKRKKTGQEKELQLEGEAVSSLVGHTQGASSVKWPEPKTIYSASWDQSIKEWNVERGTATSTIYHDEVLNCIDIGGEGSALIAAGGSDPIVRVWDPRKPGTSASIKTFSSHTSWVTACKWHDKSLFHLVSASHDGKVMLWDTRTAALCADWWKGDTVLSGGADFKLCMTSGVSVPPNYQSTESYYAH